MEIINDIYIYNLLYKPNKYTGSIFPHLENIHNSYNYGKSL